MFVDLTPHLISKGRKSPAYGQLPRKFDPKASVCKGLV